MKYCNKCGVKWKKETSFCYNCGTSSLHKHYNSTDLKCSKCKTTLEKGISFCGECGTKINKSIHVSVPVQSTSLLSSSLTLFFAFILITGGLLLPTKVISYQVPVPYTEMEQYTIEIPYKDVEKYIETIPYVEEIQYFENIPVTETESYPTEDCTFLGLICQTKTTYKTVTRYKPVPKTRQETKYREETRYRTVDKIKTETREKEVQKIRMETRYKEVNWLFGSDPIMRFRNLP